MLTSPYRFYAFFVGLPTLVVGVAAGGVAIAIHTHDAHWINRSGAVIAAVAAAVILAQISFEIAIEKERHTNEQRENALIGELEDLTPISRLEGRLISARTEYLENRLVKFRLRVAALVVTTAMLGELLHGFGDLLGCACIGLCTTHP